MPWVLDGRPLAGDVLEIGAGSGAMAEAVARTFPDVRLTVTDLDPVMLASARERLARCPGVQVQEADVTALPFEDESFDVVTSYLMLHHVIEWRLALGEVARVTRRGGTVLGYDLTDTALARLVHRVDGSPHRIIAPDELHDGLAAEGLVDISVRLSTGSHLMRFRASKPTVGRP
jgi:ubiquinone/menaquinone biosynthesis C-methylase UbiE